MGANQTNASPATRGSAAPLLPILEIRFTATYAWILIGAGVAFFLLSFLVGSKNVALGILIAILSIGAMFGGNYWRHHLHVVARMTPRLLVLRREGSLSWTDIAAIERSVARVRARLHQAEGAAKSAGQASGLSQQGQEGRARRLRHRRAGIGAIVLRGLGSSRSARSAWRQRPARRDLTRSQPRFPAARASRSIYR